MHAMFRYRGAAVGRAGLTMSKLWQDIRGPMVAECAEAHEASRLIDAVAKVYGRRALNIPLRNIASQFQEEIYRKPTSNKMRELVFARDHYRCCSCGSLDDLVCDHFYPVSRGGKTIIENLQTLCWTCNSRKGARVHL